MTPPKLEDIHELKEWKAAKDAECEAHQDWTKGLSETLRHPECGLVVKLAKVEETVQTLKALSYSILTGVGLVLISLVGYFYHESQQTRQSPQISAAQGK